MPVASSIPLDGDGFGDGDNPVNHAIYSTASGSLSALDRLDAITHNLANASTPGFKAQLVVQGAHPIQHAQGKGPSVSTPINRSRVETDFSQGSIVPDGDAFHLALSGEGFFVVDGPTGERLTRRGSFSLDEQGFLVTSDGMRVQGDGGNVALGDAATDGTIEISPDGTIQAGENRLGRVRVATVADPQSLVREGSAVFAPNGQTISDAADGTFHVRQGALESSNATPITNLVALIETMRGFEAYMTATTRIDQVNERTINDVART
ncbi:MAG: flagellar hook basal-body protein [Deltaproteobacteria bacterium]|nr:flagellar hook basal-body protein [Deltaproteobacteria bacterium]